MEQSLTLLTAQVHFLDTKLSLIHVPLHLYTSFVQPILHLILPPESASDTATEDDSSGSDVLRPRRSWAYEHPFVNVSLTPVECSIACSTALVRELFLPITQSLCDEDRSQVAISSEQFVVIQVDGEGLDAGQRVLELTSPLAMNGISIFFITTYFSDYILVPLRSRAPVIKALEARGFVFSKESEGFVNVSSPLVRPMSGHQRSSSTASSLDQGRSSSYFEAPPSPISSPPAPGTPPPSSISELESRTFATLRKRQVVPTVDPTIQLIQCAGRKDTLRGETGAHASSAASALRLQLGLVKCLITTPRPRFLSLTLTDTEPASLLLEKRLLINFESDGDGDGDAAVLLGSREDILTPITLDLRELPMESTGIVCGIAGRLVGGTSSNRSPLGLDGSEQDSIEMSYLSTARAGTVMVPQSSLDRALDALKGDEDNGLDGLPLDSLEMKKGGSLLKDW